ncbi:hypothetical protein RHGRI_033938 [Rhododendron griersonianum]|uniref:Transmembrane protein n=1 Tax=Rhododendron griersonianum TaxID=479676 RepID=A0AAV6HYM3_9ERIC|nr:hypothetical protein RHGRI_033938 [Rhododendron griersonianum]
MFNECYTPTFANGETVFPHETPFVDISTSSGTPTSNAIPAATRTNANTPRSNANTQTSNANAPTSNVVQGRPKKKAKVDGNDASIHVAMENLLAQSNTAFNKIADAGNHDDHVYFVLVRATMMIMIITIWFMAYSVAVICPILYSVAGSCFVADLVLHAGHYCCCMLASFLLFECASCCSAAVMALAVVVFWFSEHFVLQFSLWCACYWLEHAAIF